MYSKTMLLSFFLCIAPATIVCNISGDATQTEQSTKNSKFDAKKLKEKYQNRILGSVCVPLIIASLAYGVSGVPLDFLVPKTLATIGIVGSLNVFNWLFIHMHPNYRAIDIAVLELSEDALLVGLALYFIDTGDYY